MLPILLTFASYGLAVEIAKRLRLLESFRQLAATGARARRVLSYRHCLELRKERGLKRLSLRLLIHSLASALLLMLMLLPFAALAAADAALELEIMAALLEWRVRLILLVLSVGYAFARLRFERRLRPS